MLCSSRLLKQLERSNLVSVIGKLQSATPLAGPLLRVASENHDQNQQQNSLHWQSCRGRQMLPRAIQVTFCQLGLPMHTQ
jgi:hypothetical protein